MAIAANPGIGQGKGGGRPKREARVRLRLDLSPEATALLEARAEALDLPLWRVVDDLVKGAPVAPKAPPHLQEALQIAGQIEEFLEGAQDRAAALKTLQRAWDQAFALARHTLQAPPPSDAPPDHPEVLPGEALQPLAGDRKTLLDALVKFRSGEISAEEIKAITKQAKLKNRKVAALLKGAKALRRLP